ncbi:MAG: DNA sulfur modification protein DndD [Jaaginema sp. PMC 1079.18]|nr:DNA sulfur modification protein DndD [Jaaginema sp. PMC 1080.18]MEC4852824.1 DNA sulfur modification protein DndD [Jaaginema sp. PMC 1079.18]MEC4867875.1 DNA sulfur modification protein DndD [Jaaginema sp. PMC 1078.18]
MIFRELVLQNFGPYLGRQVINLSPEIEGEMRPIILLGGMNGGGKTTMMDAIRLAFYGQRAQCSTRGNLSYSDFLNQCVNRQVKGVEETVVELAFEHIYENTNVVYRIRRSWLKNDKNNKDKLEVSIDTWFDSALTKTWDEYIEDILPLGISNLFLFDGEQVKELAELDSPPSQVVTAIQSLLGLELAERLAVDLDILVSRKRKALASTEDLATLEEIEQKLERQKAEYEDTKASIKPLQNQLKQAQKDFHKAEDRFMTEGGKIAAERSQLETKVKEINAEIDNCREQMREIAAGISPLALITPLLVQAQNQAQNEQNRANDLASREVIEKRDRRLLEYLTNISIANSKINKIKAFLEAENQAIAANLDPNAKPWLYADPEVIETLTYLQSRDLPNQLNQLQDLQQKLSTLEEAMGATERQLQNAAPPEEYEKLKNAVKNTQNYCNEAKITLENRQQQIEQLAQIIEETKRELKQFSEQNIDRKSNEHIIQSATKVQETLKLFREKLTLKKLNKLEIEVTECFRYLLHKSDLVHRVAIDAESFSLSLYDPQGQPLPKHRLSAGEKQLLAIAFLWGIARISGRHLPVAIDTPLGRLDSSHRNNLVERYFPAASMQVILLSTDTEIGETEYQQLKDLDAIAHSYLLAYDPDSRQTTVQKGYFWNRPLAAQSS